jgi:hypothetical protein
VPAGEDAVHGAHPARRRDHEPGPPVPRPRPPGPGVGLEGPHHGRAHGDHPPSPRAGGVDAPGRRRRHPVALGVRRLPRLRRGDAGVQHDGREAHSGRRQLGHEAVGEAAAGARHLGAPRHRREDRLVVLDRPARGGAPVADRAPVGVEVAGDRPRQRQPGAPQAHAAPRPAGGGPQQLQRAVPRDPQPALAGLDPVRHAAHPAPPTQLHEPVAAGQGRGEVHQEAARRLQRGGQSRGQVHHEQVARPEVARQPAHGVVAQTGGAVGHQQPRRVPGQPAPLDGRRVPLNPGVGSPPGGSRRGGAPGARGSLLALNRRRVGDRGHEATASAASS